MKQSWEQKVEANRELAKKLEAQAREAQEAGNMARCRELYSRADNVHALADLEEREARHTAAIMTGVHARHFVQNVLAGPQGTSALDG